MSAVTNANTRDRVAIWCEDWCTGHTHMVTNGDGTYTLGPTHSTGLYLIPGENKLKILSCCVSTVTNDDIAKVSRIFVFIKEKFAKIMAKF